MDVPAVGADIFASSSHKWFCGPKKCGVLAVPAEIIPRLWPSIVAPGWGGDADPDPTGARKFESMGQRDDACLAAMGTTAEFQGEIGPDRVEKRMIDLARRLKEGIREAGIPLVTPIEDALSAGVVIIEVPAESRGEVFSRMYDDHGRGLYLRRIPSLARPLQHGGVRGAGPRRAESPPTSHRGLRAGPPVFSRAPLRHLRASYAAQDALSCVLQHSQNSLLHHLLNHPSVLTPIGNICRLQRGVQ